MLSRQNCLRWGTHPLSPEDDGCSPGIAAAGALGAFTSETTPESRAGDGSMAGVSSMTTDTARGRRKGLVLAVLVRTALDVLDRFLDGFTLAPLGIADWKKKT